MPVTDKLPATKTTVTPVFTTADIRLTALTSNDEKDIETIQADKTEKLNGSFIVKSNNYQSKYYFYGYWLCQKHDLHLFY